MLDAQRLPDPKDQPALARVLSLGDCSGVVMLKRHRTTEFVMPMDSPARYMRWWKLLRLGTFWGYGTFAHFSGPVRKGGLHSTAAYEWARGLAVRMRVGSEKALSSCF